MKVFVEMFNNIEDIKREFASDCPELKGVRTIYAEYIPGDYCGDAFVLFKKAGKWYEVNGGHCSCYGLEGQWAPELTDLKAIKMRTNSKDLEAFLGKVR